MFTNFRPRLDVLWSSSLSFVDAEEAPVVAVVAVEGGVALGFVVKSILSKQSEVYARSLLFKSNSFRLSFLLLASMSRLAVLVELAAVSLLAFVLI